MSLLAPTNLVPGNLVPPLPSLLNSSLQTLQEGEEIVSVCLSVCLPAWVSLCLSAHAVAKQERRRRELGKQEAGGVGEGREKVTK